MPQHPIDPAVIRLLSQPFDAEDVLWKPQTVNYKNKTATAAAYADPRSYVDRLNAAVGPSGWSDSYSFIVTPFTKLIRGRKAYGGNPATEDKFVSGDKVLCICTLEIEGIKHSSTGDADASDENAATSAEAQAFKRACMKFGLGRYFYDLPKQILPYDDGFLTTPKLPEWALPHILCDDCSKEVLDGEHDGKTYSSTIILGNGRKKYDGKNLCMACQRVRAEKARAAAGTKI